MLKSNRLRTLNGFSFMSRRGMHERQTLYNDPEVVEKVYEFMSFLFTDAELQRLETEGVAPDLSTLNLSRHRSPLAVHAMMYINAALKVRPPTIIDVA